MRKGTKRAKKKMITVPMDGSTIPFAINMKRGAARIMLKPAPKGSGVIAGGPIRAVVEAAGIRDISSKILGTNNQASNVYATFEALKNIEKIVKVKNIKLKSIAEMEAGEAKKLEELQKQAAEQSKKSAPKAEAKIVAAKPTVAKPKAEVKKPVATSRREAKKAVKA